MQKIKDVLRKNQTYSIDTILIDALHQMAFFEKVDKAEIVRRALWGYVPQKYIDMVTPKEEGEN